jgi:predicted RNase H-like HicB family nuclease
MTANPSIFSDDRSIQSLPIATVRDAVTGTYTAWYVDMPYLVVQGENKEDAKERLRELLMMYLNNICKR